MPHTLPTLPYAYTALEPHIDARTMEIHHTKHHQAYVDKLNAAIAGTPFENLSVEELLLRIADVPEEKKTAVRNHGGGHANHSLFWTILSPSGGAQPPAGDFAKDMNDTFGGFEAFQGKFTEAATGIFGSGWAWLVLNEKKGLQILSTPNQDSPLMMQQIPLFGLDVWEHAYYLNYQNRRPDYVKAFWSIVSWEEVSRRYALAAGAGDVN